MALTPRDYAEIMRKAARDREVFCPLADQRAEDPITWYLPTRLLYGLADLVESGKLAPEDAIILIQEFRTQFMEPLERAVCSEQYDRLLVKGQKLVAPYGMHLGVLGGLTDSELKVCNQAFAKRHPGFFQAEKPLTVDDILNPPIDDSAETQDLDDLP